MDPDRTWHEEHAGKLTLGEWLADKIASGMGSWTFLIAQTLCIAGWIVLNLVAWMQHWDEYPFILLNLLFSTQAAYAAPVIMMSQNRQAARDRVQADHDYQTNLAAKAEIEQLQRHLHQIEDKKLDALIEGHAAQNRRIDLLAEGMAEMLLRMPAKKLPKGKPQ